MNEFVRESLFFGMFISLLAYEAGLLIKKKWKMAVLNPLLISILLVLSFLLLTGVEYEFYNSSAKYLSYLLTPATVCLAIPLYRELSHLKKNFKAIAAGTVAGVLTSMAVSYTHLGRDFPGGRYLRSGTDGNDRGKGLECSGGDSYG